MNLIDRPFDIVSGSNDLETLYTFDNFPVYMGCTDQDISQDISTNMNWKISRSSGMIQLDPLVPLEIVYQSEHNPGTTGKAWMDHHTEFSKFILKYNPKAVYEIGGSHGTLCNISVDTNPHLKWTIIEPNPVYIEGIKGKIIKGFFLPETQLPSDVDMVVHSHVLEHVYNPREFFREFSKRAKGTKVCVSIPNLVLYLNKFYTNSLNFEHTYLCSEPYVEWWFKTNGYKLNERFYYSDFSIFYCFEKDDLISSEPYPNLYEENKLLFLQYVNYHKKLVTKINEKINNHQGEVYLFGAHVFSQFLFNFGLDQNKIGCILDNSKLKQGKRLYGTKFKVSSPTILKDQRNPLVILRAGVFNNEIKYDIINNINSSTIFIEEV